MDRKYTRIDTIRGKLDPVLNELKDDRLKRNGYVHLYGVGQAAALLALRRGFGRDGAELAEIAGMLHDYAKYFIADTEDHAHIGEPYVRDLLTQTGEFTEQEIHMICRAVYCHTDKFRVDDPFDELIKDADSLQHYLRNPREDFWYSQKRIQDLVKELAL